MTSYVPPDARNATCSPWSSSSRISTAARSGGRTADTHIEGSVIAWDRASHLGSAGRSDQAVCRRRSVQTSRVVGLRVVGSRVVGLRVVGFVMVVPSLGLGSPEPRDLIVSERRRSVCARRNTPTVTPVTMR